MITGFTVEVAYINLKLTIIATEYEISTLQ